MVISEENNNKSTGKKAIKQHKLISHFFKSLKNETYL